MRIAVVGGGIFGVTSAIVLARNGFKVDLFEQESDIFTHATGTNQYRLHRGYHYPRSKETIKSCFYGELEFKEVFGDAVLDNEIEHYYCIAKDGSMISGKDYKEVLDENYLEYKEEDSGIVNTDKISLSIRVKEYLYDPDRLKRICWDYLDKHGIAVLLNHKTSLGELRRNNYNLIIVATYSDNNSWMRKSTQRVYQYEVCEKLILKLPGRYNKKSVVVMDGRFMCIDPFGRSGYHCMGNVVHAVHQTVIDKKINIDDKYKEVLNKGVIPNPPFTNYDLFMDSAEEYFPGIKKDAVHIGSMFTIRTVLPYRDYDDARPTIVERVGDNVITMFSGKIPACVDAANQILYIAMDKRDI
ncbi:MAG: FAD-dependent oxidoreductase [Parcubacteria group bacterium]